MDIEIDKLREVLKAMEEFQVSELSFGHEENQVYLKRSIEKEYVQSVPQHEMPMQLTHQAELINALSQSNSSETDSNTPEEEDVRVVTSPVVGVFYSSPGPEQSSYVEVGSEVAEGDVLCIIEAMKLMNEVNTPYDGIVEEILVSSGQKVEFGQPLFKIR